MSGFAIAKRTIGFKIEDTPYSGENLQADDFNLQAYNIQYTPGIESYGRKLARGDYSKDPSVAGRRTGQVTFSVDVHFNATVTSAPNYWKCLQACGMRQYTGPNGVWLKPDANYSNVPATIEVPERDEGTNPAQLVMRLRGAMGTAKLVSDALGKPARIDFDFKGVLDNISDRAYAEIFVPTGFGTAQPEAVLGITTTLFSKTMKHSKVEFDLGNVVDLWSDPSKAEGIEGARISDRNPTITIDPDMVLIATNDIFGAIKANTTGTFSMTIGNKGTISAPAAQLVDAYKPGEREGHVTNQLKIELKRDLGNDELTILQGSQS